MKINIILYDDLQNNLQINLNNNNYKNNIKVAYNKDINNINESNLNEKLLIQINGIILKRKNDDNLSNGSINLKNKNIP